MQEARFPTRLRHGGDYWAPNASLRWDGAMFTDAGSRGSVISRVRSCKSRGSVCQLKFWWYVYSFHSSLNLQAVKDEYMVLNRQEGAGLSHVSIYLPSETLNANI